MDKGVKYAFSKKKLFPINNDKGNFIGNKMHFLQIKELLYILDTYLLIINNDNKNSFSYKIDNT